jgi:hypothetical protein
VRPRRAPLIAAHWEFNNMKLQETLIRLKRFQVE